MKYLPFFLFLPWLIMCGTSNKIMVPETKLNPAEKDSFVFDTNYIARKFRNPVGNPPGKKLLRCTTIYAKHPLRRGLEWNRRWKF